MQSPDYIVGHRIWQSRANGFVSEEHVLPFRLSAWAGVTDGEAKICEDDE